MNERIWIWRAWSVEQKRLCDAGWCRAATRDEAIAAARQIVGGPHLELVDEIAVDEIPFHVSTARNRTNESAARGEAMRFGQLRERIALLATSEEDVDPPDSEQGELDLDNMPVLLRVQNEDGELMVGGLYDIDVEVSCDEKECIMLDAQGGP